MVLSRKYTTWQLVNQPSLLLVLRGCGSSSPIALAASHSHNIQRQYSSNCNVLIMRHTTASTMNRPLISYRSRRISCIVGKYIKALTAATASCLTFPTLKQRGMLGSTYHYCKGFHSSSLGMNTQGPGLDKVSLCTYCCRLCCMSFVRSYCFIIIVDHNNVASTYV